MGVAGENTGLHVAPEPLASLLLLVVGGRWGLLGSFSRKACARLGSGRDGREKEGMERGTEVDRSCWRNTAAKGGTREKLILTLLSNTVIHQGRNHTCSQPKSWVTEKE